MKNVVFHIPSIHNLSSYKSAVRALPDLTAAEEKQLAIELQENNNLESAQRLVLSQLKTVVKVAQEYKNYGLDDADLIQEGNIGLMRAVKHFDYTKNVRLYTFSLVWIRSEMQAYIVKNWKMVKIATTKNLKKLFFNYRKLYKEFEHQGIAHNQIPQHIQKALNVDEKELSDIRNYFSGNDLAVEDLTNSDPEQETYHTIPSQLIEHKTPESLMIKYRDKAKEQRLFQAAYQNLNDREKTVIQYRFLSDPQKTHKDISHLLGISSERVRQIEVATIQKLKETVENPQLLSKLPSNDEEVIQNEYMGLPYTASQEHTEEVSEELEGQEDHEDLEEPIDLIDVKDVFLPSKGAVTKQPKNSSKQVSNASKMILNSDLSSVDEMPEQKSKKFPKNLSIQDVEPKQALLNKIKPL